MCVRLVKMLLYVPVGTIKCVARGSASGLCPGSPGRGSVQSSLSRKAVHSVCAVCTLHFNYFMISDHIQFHHWPVSSRCRCVSCSHSQGRKERLDGQRRCTRRRQIEGEQIARGSRWAACGTVSSPGSTEAHPGPPGPGAVFLAMLERLSRLRSRRRSSAARISPATAVRLACSAASRARSGPG